MKNGSIMDKYLEDIIRDIRIIFLKHSRELCEVECKKADVEGAEKLETLDNSSRDKQDNIEERYDQIDKIFEQRKDVLQFHRTSFASHQVNFRPGIHGPPILIFQSGPRLSILFGFGPWSPVSVKTWIII